MSYKKQLETAKEVAVKAGKRILEIYNTDFDNTIEYKADNSPLTIADTTSNELIVTRLKSDFPEISILSEESKQDPDRMKNDFCFIVDPLDGTKEFIKKNGEFTVNIALVYKKRPVMGVIYVPVTGELFYASKGDGAYKISDGTTKRLNVSNKKDNLIMAASKSHAGEKLQALIEAKKELINSTISAGSSLKGTMIAEAKADVYYRFGYTSEWDVAAMHCIVEEAGGIFRQMDNTEMLYNRENNLNEKGFFAVNIKENIWV